MDIIDIEDMAAEAAYDDRMERAHSNGVHDFTPEPTCWLCQRDAEDETDD